MRDDFFSTIGEIIKYGGSTFAALVAMSIYMATDGFFVGNWVGVDGLEAMALIFPITMVIAAVGVLFETGGSAVVSEQIGAGKKQLAEKIIRSNYLCAAIIGVTVAVVGNIFIEPLLGLLVDNSSEQHITDLAVDFLRITLCGAPFLITVYMTGAFMRCVEKPEHVFFLVGSSNLVNIILDALFIIVFGWGMTGAAVATVIAQISGAVIAFWYFKYSRQKFSSSAGFASFAYIFKEIKIGAGFAVATVMTACIEYFLNAVVLQYDAAELLAMVTVSNIILSFVFLPLNGLDTGIQPLVSRLYAAHQEQHCLRVMRYGFFLTVVLTFAIYAVLMIFTEEMTRLFVETNTPITPEMIIFLRAMFVLQPFVGLYTWLSGLMAALEDEWRNLVISLVPLVVQVPLIWFLPKILPIEYISLNYSINDVAEAAVAFILIRSLFKEKGISFRKIFHAR
ncbi:MAG: MATE family efflux transporter [Selenomonadaceae bacterium]|nr:MATE family efflux transporter [Selenomonadaceae bacterium]